MSYVALLILACAACGANGGPPTEFPPPGQTPLKLELVAAGLSSPVYLTTPVNDQRLFVVEQAGRIRVIRNGQLLATPFLDIRSKVSAGGERGLLSMAFHPNYTSNGQFFVNYTDVNGDTRVERYAVSADGDVANPTSGKLILTVDQPFSNHNGGLVVFGPDGKLYIGMGDGGSGGDPQNHGQNRATLLGALLRIDVDAGDPYAIPPDNPYAGSTQFRPEIWAYGLRNPWRFSFDRTAGILYVADVGQNQWEEINAVPAAQTGVNYGWKLMEGAHCYTSNCNPGGLQLPVHEYDHSGGACSVTGGYAYRGSRIPSLAGHYFYADYCAGFVKSFRLVDGRATEHTTWPFTALRQVTSFGQDSAGELYILTADGRVHRIVI